ncbi:MAG: TfoX/Sxy family protein [Flavisolibacter sp.]|jgi:TfoX/Sxy family transcriptional regulator of competence genes|nr:TfoX/Sxy family protein [Flavisolibacter sp.]
MAQNEELSNRIRVALAETPKVIEKKMFRGTAFMVDDKLCITAGDNYIMCRIDPALYEGLITNKVCRPVVMKGRELKGYVYVDEAELKTVKELDHWVALCLDFNPRAKSSKKKTKAR